MNFLIPDDMPDKKLTDNEIIKALKEILKLMCNEGDLQRSATISNALDLINRQNAEIERLTKCRKEEVEKLMSATDKVILEAKAEGIKEFAERLKQNAYHNDANEYIVFDIEVDNLLKELVGEK